MGATYKSFEERIALIWSITLMLLLSNSTYLDPRIGVFFLMPSVCPERVFASSILRNRY